MKQALLRFMDTVGFFAALRQLNRRRGLILTYHRFSAYDRSVGTTARDFAEQLEYLTAHYRLVPISQMARHLSVREELPRGLAAITIDDGYRDAYEIAYPLLNRYDACATLYTATDFVEGRIWLWTDKLRYLTGQAAPQVLSVEIGGKRLEFRLSDEAGRRAAAEQINGVLKRLSDEAKEEEIEKIACELGVELPVRPPEEFAAVTWDQAREMDQDGVEIGSHTATHPILTNIDDARLAEELEQSRDCLERALRRKVEHFCYPNGDYDERVRRATAQAGYLTAVTCDGGLNLPGGDLLTLRRIHTESDLAHFAQSTSGFEQIKEQLRKIAGPSPQPVSGTKEVVRRGEERDEWGPVL